MAPPRSRRGSLSRNKDKGKCSSVFSLQLKHGGWLRDGEYLGGSSDYFYNMEIDHWGLIILNDKLKELKYMNIDNVKYFLKTKGGVVELVNEVVAWQTFNELDLLDGVEVWAVNGEWETEIDEQYWLHDSDSDEGLEEFVDSDLESNADLVDDLEYDNNIDSNVEFCGTGEVVEGEQEQVSNLEVELDFSDEDSLRDNSSDDDRFPILPHFKEKTQMKSPKFSVGLSFKSKAQFKQAVKNYGFANGKEIKFVKDDKGRVVGKCKHDTCQWEIRAKKENMGMDWIVSTFNDVHEGCTWTWKNKMANSTVVAQRWKREIQAHDNWKTANFCEKVVNEEKFFINKRQAYRALVKAKASIEAEQHDNFKKLWSYIKEIKKNNPNTTISVKLSDLDDYETGKKRVLRMYICWEASRVGYRFCRPIIGVDGCFLKSKYGGQLLLAVGVDGDDSIFPLAYAIVENETKDSWTWFLERLKRDLSISDDNQHELTFISDKQKGLLPAFDSVFPGARHRFCVRHLHGNMKVAGFTGKALKNALWEAARCTTVSTFKESMKKIKDLDPKAYEWLVSKDPSEWSRAYFTDHPHCDMLVNNVCESFSAPVEPVQTPRQPQKQPNEDNEVPPDCRVS